jgi:IS5 family transposase
LSFAGKHEPNNRCGLIQKLIPWMSLERHYSPQFTAKTGAPATPFQMALGVVCIQQRLGVTDQETVELIKESRSLNVHRFEQ